MTLKYRIRAAILAASLTVLAGCGGAPAPVEPIPSIPPAPPAITSQMDNLLADVRTPSGLSAPVRSVRLNAAARAHADDMIARNYFAHVSPGGGRLMDRVRAQGYSACHVSENIAWGQESETEVLNAWLNSPGHRANIMSSRSNEFGFARRTDPSGPRSPVWVLVFADPGC